MTSNLYANYTYSLLLMFEEGAVRCRLKSTVHFICMLPIGPFSVCFSYHSVSALLLSYKVEYGIEYGVIIPMSGAGRSNDGVVMHTDCTVLHNALAPLKYDRYIYASLMKASQSNIKQSANVSFHQRGRRPSTCI